VKTQCSHADQEHEIHSESANESSSKLKRFCRYYNYYVSNKINLSQVHISSFFICNILISFNCLDFIFTIVLLHDDERSANLFVAWHSAGAFALAWVVILLLQLSFFRTHCQCLQNPVQWLGFWKTYNYVAVHPVCAIYFLFWSDCKMKSISIYSDSGNSQIMYCWIVCTCLGCWWYLWSGLLRCLAASFFVVAGPLLAGAVVNLGTWACLVHYSKCLFFLKETLLLKPEHWSLQSWG
jgi:hypothetical protein